MYGIGALGMLVCVVMRRERYRLNVLQCFVFALLLTACGIAGARLLSFLESGMKAFGGVSFYGSIFLIPMVMPIVGLPFRLKPWETTDLCAPCGAIMMVFVRIGCLIGGCCGGWVVYIGDIYFAWPTQIMECIGDLLIAYWLLRVEKREKWQGLLNPLWMISYSIMRFLLEFLRYTPEKWHNLGYGQWSAMMAIVISVVWIKIHKRNFSSKND
jgi:phosphatidylglycerol:prolipoprotein diacylglycerol transferase